MTLSYPAEGSAPLGSFRCKAIRLVKETVPPDRIPSHPKLHVVSAVINRNELFLISQRKLEDRFGGMWEFPGGKVEPGESLQDALVRELLEEVGVECRVQDHLKTVPNRYPDLDLDLHFFRAEIVQGEPHAVDAKDVRWVPISELFKIELSTEDEEFLNQLKTGF